VEFAGIEIARTTRALRILETSHPPVYYLPPGDVAMERLQPTRGTTFCEWKGTASYYDIVADDRISPRAVWTYHRPDRRYAELRDYLAFYPSRVDACYVGDELVAAQEGDFYGGWITAEIVGPFKGGAGTFGW
jgi:uncharacterized protein (DUF427 family)